MTPEQQWVQDGYLSDYEISYVCGFIEGYLRAVRRVALAMVKADMDRALILKCTELSEKELDRLVLESGGLSQSLSGPSG
ncbi:hypothetical protein [Chromobacterium alticapitis]|uniref:Uncharacterized protein n=1 Tax=Chromobacterium alticapitis TaxID=2073169 RepID=A0A2S5DCX0_9NEIS|nr:hypothetical protein [Chromobacterium alticapitis]POZ60943.1 hypothetical protein C2I19_16235 [Chromobacterium alticapitis]